MILELSAKILDYIHVHGESSYPEEGAGLMLGKVNGEYKRVISIIKYSNAREDNARHNRYLLTPQDYIHGEQEASNLGLEMLGIFHSHPDHPNRPSEFDREWAMPWFSYVITSVQAGNAVDSRSWLLSDDRSHFFEEEIRVISDQSSATSH